MGTGGSKTHSPQTERRALRRGRRVSRPDAEPEVDPASNQLLHSAHSDAGDLREAVTRSSGDSTAGIVLSLQRAYGNRAVAGLLQRQTPGETPEGGGGSSPGMEPTGGGPSGSASDQPMLRAGSVGAAVNQLQAILNTLGASPPVAVDGQFGSGTRSAVVAFQRQHGLEADGVVGPKTWGSLYGTQPVFATDTTPKAVPQGAIVGGETPDEEADADFTHAMKLFDAGDYVGALPFFRRVYSLPELQMYKRASALYKVASCYHRLGQKEQAISALEEFLTIPETKAGDHKLALERLRELRTGEEIKTAEDILRPPSPAEQAAADAQALVEINAAHACGHSGDNRGALTHAQNAYALRYASLHFRLAATVYSGLAHRELGEFDSALDFFQEGLGFPESAFNKPVGDATPVSRESLLLAMRNARAGQTETVPDQPPMPAEEREAQTAQAHELFKQGQYAASLAVLERLYRVTDEHKERAQITIYMGQCHQRLGRHEEAVSLYMEVLGYPGLSEAEMALVQELLRQARMREVGTHITAGEPGKAALPGEVLPLFVGEVYFETGSAAVNSIGESTLQSFGALLNERRAAEPATEIVVGVIGHASSRWRTAPTDQWRQQLNEKLSQERADTVSTKLQVLAPTPPFLYSVDVSGDVEGRLVTSNTDDNTWFFRSVTIVAIPRPSPALPGAEQRPT